MKYDMMRVLVTGGAGFIGSHVIEDLAKYDDVRVVCLDNFSTGKASNIVASCGAEVIHGDIRNKFDVRYAMDGVTHVIHLAAQVSVPASIEDPVESAEHNITGFLNVLDTARKAKVKKFVYASSAAVYGSLTNMPLTETLTAPISPYGMEKLINEKYAILYHELYHLQSFGLRFFNVYGPRQDPASPYSGVISKFMSSIKEHMPITIYGDGEQTRDFVYVSDVAKSIFHALKLKETGICNICRNHQISLNELVTVISKIAGFKPQIIYKPARAGDIKFSVGNKAFSRDLDFFNPTDIKTGLELLYNYK